MYDEFVALKYSCASVTHALPHVSRLFGRAPDLVREFLNLRHAFNAYWFRQHSPMADDPPVPRSESPGPQEKADIQNLLSLPEIDIPEDHRKQTNLARGQPELTLPVPLDGEDIYQAVCG